MNSSDQALPSLCQRLTKRWHALAWWEQIVVLTAGIGAFIVAVFLYQMFGWYPGPHVRGVVIDRTTGKPVAGAYVVVSIRVTKPSIHSYQTGCSIGSGIAITDEQGRYEYSVSMAEAFRRPYAERRPINLSVYHPDYAMPAPNIPQHTEGWAVRAHGGVQRIEMVPKSAAAAARYLEIDGSFGTGCLGYSHVFDPAPLYRAIYPEKWELICGPTSDPALLDGALARQATRSLSATLGGLTNPHPLPDDWNGMEPWRPNYGETGPLENYPWSPDAPDHGRPLTAQERAGICDFYAPPIERVLAKEKRS